jgi:ATP-dependent Clp protease adapter protein ClpS
MQRSKRQTKVLSDTPWQVYNRLVAAPMGENSMAESDKTPEPRREDSGSGTATAKPKRAPKKNPQQKPPQPLPPWKVLLHNDDKNEMHFVVRTVMELTPLKEQEASERTTEANDTGVALLLVTHKERAELYKEQFESKGLTVTIEPAE